MTTAVNRRMAADSGRRGNDGRPESTSPPPRNVESPYEIHNI
jgi:hypothetical protein